MKPEEVVWRALYMRLPLFCPGDTTIAWLNDSKKLSPRKREFMRSEIEKNALVVGCSVLPITDEIDEMNILRASILAMHRALDKIATYPRPDPG